MKKQDCLFIILTDFVTVITKEKKIGEFLVLLVNQLRFCNVEALESDLQAHYDRTKTLQGIFSFPSLIGVFRNGNWPRSPLSPEVTVEAF